LVGIVAASILLWVFFSLRRRRRRSAVFAALGTAEAFRAPLDDEVLPERAQQSPYDPSPGFEMNQRSGSRFGLTTMHSQPSNGRMSGYQDAPEPEGDPSNSYAEFGVTSTGRRDGYQLARTSSPDGHGDRERKPSTSTSGFVVGHSANQSMGSYEPLLASHRRPSNASPPPSSSAPLPPLTSATEQNTAPNGDHHPENTSPHHPVSADDRLDPKIRERLENGGDNASAREPRDEEDYTRPVLSVRNLPGPP
jgi:hypothetical protein